MKKNIFKPAFTLVEMLISISVFMLFLSLSFNAYVYLTQANRTANDTQKLYREVRHVFDVVATSVRGASIDFSCIDKTGATTPAECITNTTSEKPSVIAFIEDHGAAGATRIFYKFEDAGLWIYAQEKKSPEVPWAPVGSWERLTSESIKLDDVAFSIFPLADPYSHESAFLDELQWQPSVGISITKNGKIFRTTYSSRFYGRQPLYAD